MSKLLILATLATGLAIGALATPRPNGFALETDGGRIIERSLTLSDCVNEWKQYPADMTLVCTREGWN